MTAAPRRADGNPVRVGELSLDQRISLLSGGSFWGTRSIPEHGVPSVTLTDGPHGVRHQRQGEDNLGIFDSEPATCFPPAVAVGSSWNRDVARRMGQAIAEEAKALGVGVVLGPGVNIKRTPLNGRNFEYFSEDPYLTGVLAAEQAAAQESAGVGASVKHFALNNQETERMRISADVDERTMREIYLPAFERVVTTAKPATIMCSYNAINGIPAAENTWLLTDLLRREWGYEGVVVSDWGAVQDRVTSLRAGLDLEMPGGRDSSPELAAAVADGRLEQSVIDASASRVLELSAYHGATGSPVDHDRQHALSRTLALECPVLLKNDGSTLPLRAGQRIAVIGELAENPRYQGGGSSRIVPTHLDIPVERIRHGATDLGMTVEYAAGYSLEASHDAATLANDAVETARRADVAVVFAGLRESDESEGFDRTTLTLPDDQIALIRSVAAAAPRTAVVLFNGGIVSLEEWHDDVDAILEAWLLGQGGGAAIADLLLGVVSPSGRLAETIPLRLEDTPSYLTHPGEQGHTRYGEGVMVGYRYYTAVDHPVRYPFGHGLSYSRFTASDITVERSADDDTALTVEVLITNAGGRAASHVVQLYVSTAAGPVRRPRRELKGFVKIALTAGETRRVRLPLERRSFAYWDSTHDSWVVAPGEYRIEIAENADRVIQSTTITLVGDALPTRLTIDSTVQEWIEHPIYGQMLFPTQEGAEPSDLTMIASMPLRQFLNFPGVPLSPRDIDHILAADPVSG
ncbi:glycoside hydrolase family 3 C-terminal domain-containing protein [Herbiconiux sp. A18JL235]|uniref:Exo-alpha-(1->6)-L-arabinopyranosidase n=1 Tax=Herbiconiux sp. A18JL235 TaxID=3152363 RepID=A0AB39BJ90_9MICO